MSCVIPALHGIAVGRAENLRKLVAERDQLLSAASASSREKDEYLEDIKSR